MVRNTYSRTEQAQYLFKVKEHVDGTPWIVAEPLREEMPMLKNAYLGFHLPHGMKLEEAEKLAEFLNNNLIGITLSVSNKHPLYKVAR